jgi:rhodanese-related sulfurtransferase
MREIQWQKKPGLKSVFLLLFILLVSAAVMEGNAGDKSKLKDVSAEKSLEVIEENIENPDFVILDVRTPSEFKEGHLENAENVDFYADTFKDELGKLDKNKSYLIYCASGNRSGKSLKIMDEMGFTEVYNMLGGFKGWSSKGLPFVR